MRVIHALQDISSARRRSIFLAGPTPRDAGTPSWRPDALRWLDEVARFDGDVFVPEASNWLSHDSYDLQIDWEWAGIDAAGCVAFWVPREILRMPAFTTNVEFGYTVRGGNVVLGYPEGAPKMSYLARLAGRHGVPVHRTMEETLAAAVRVATAAA